MMSFNFDISKERIIDEEKASKLPNNHMHSKWCNHAECHIQEIVDIMIEKNIDGVLNEHIYVPDNYLDSSEDYSFKEDDDGKKNIFRDNTFKPEDIDLFIDDIKKVKDANKLIDSYLPVGFEIDGLRGFEQEVNNSIKYLELKFRESGLKVNHFSLSLHLIRGFWSYGESGKKILEKYSISEIIDIYFDDFLSCIEKIDKISFICHPGLLEMFLKKCKKDFKFTDDEYVKYINSYKILIDKCVELNLGVEINTSGFRKISKDSPYMPYEVFKYALLKGVKFVTSTDFHWRGQELYCFDQLYDFLVKEGVKKVYKVRDHKLIPVDLV